MSVVNKYPELPEVPYKKTAANISEVITYIKNMDISFALKVAIYTVFYNESDAGKKGVNENYAGIQADNSKWPDDVSSLAVATTVVKENMTGQYRRFLVFKDFKASIIFLSDRLKDRGLYVGGTISKYSDVGYIKDRYSWIQAYYESWVTGNKNATIPKDEKEYLLSIYAKAISILQ